MLKQTGGRRVAQGSTREMKRQEGHRRGNGERLLLFVTLPGTVP